MVDAAGHVITLGRVTLDLSSRQARFNGDLLPCRSMEFDLLATFVENVGAVLTREQLLERVWGYSFYGKSRTVDAHVGQLRTKLANTGLGIVTIKNVGYKLVLEAD